MISEVQEAMYISSFMSELYNTTVCLLDSNAISVRMTIVHHMGRYIRLLAESASLYKLAFYAQKMATKHDILIGT
jgi:hypothetical protein